MKVQEYLKQQNVWFEPILHRRTFTAQYTAQAVHARGDEVAKTVVLRANGKCVLAVLQATHKIDMMRAREALATQALTLAEEQDFRKLFPDCEVGALPPFGSQYGLKTLVDESLTHDAEIIIEGNTHEESIRMKYADFERLERPQVAAFSYHT
jgi:Ala-tRNA(Pro) deacylase